MATGDLHTKFCGSRDMLTDKEYTHTDRCTDRQTDKLITILRFPIEAEQ